MMLKDPNGVQAQPRQIWKNSSSPNQGYEAWVRTFFEHPTQNTLKPAFYARNTVEVAQDLLGKILIVCPHKQTQQRFVTMARIVETEAYRGQDGHDPAAHSARGLTTRNKIMFGDPGFAYVYFIYGMYEMLNFVTEPRDCPGAVLIRAAEPLWGQLIMCRRRNSTQPENWTRGPGRLSQAMGIKMHHNGQSLQGPALYVCDDGVLPKEILCSPRVGIAQGTDHDWRFFVKDSCFVSPARENKLGYRLGRRKTA